MLLSISIIRQFILLYLFSTQMLLLFNCYLQLSLLNNEYRHRSNISYDNKVFLMYMNQQCWFYSGEKIFKGQCGQYENKSIEYDNNLQEFPIDQLTEVNFNSSPFSGVYLQNLNDQMIFSQIYDNNQFVGQKRQQFRWNGGPLLYGPLYHKYITSRCNNKNNNFITITIQNYMYSNGLDLRNRQTDASQTKLFYNDTFIDSSCTLQNQQDGVIYVIQYNQRDGIKILHVSKASLLMYRPKIVKYVQFHRYRYHYVLNSKYVLLITYNMQWVVLVNLETIQVERYYNFNKKFIQQIYFMPRYIYDVEKTYVQDTKNNIISIVNLKAHLERLNLKYSFKFIWEVLILIVLIAIYYGTYYTSNVQNNAISQQKQNKITQYIKNQESESEIDEEEYQRLFN